MYIPSKGTNAMIVKFRGRRTDGAKYRSTYPFEKLDGNVQYKTARIKELLLY